MAEKKEGINNYYDLISEAFKRITKCWIEGEGKLEISVNNDKGYVEGSVKGAETFRTGRKNGEEG